MATGEEEVIKKQGKIKIRMVNSHPYFFCCFERVGLSVEQVDGESCIGDLISVLYNYE